MLTMTPQILRTLIFLILLSLASPLNASEKATLRILNWSEYIEVDENSSEELPLAQRSQTLRDFAKAYNCSVEYEEYESNAEMLSKIRNRPGHYDVVVISDGLIDQLHAEKLLSPIKIEQIPNIIYIKTQYWKRQTEAKKFTLAIPFLYGTTAIAYRKDLLETKIESWKQFFTPENQLKGKIALLNESHDVLAFALLALGKDANSEHKADILEAAKLVRKMKNSGYIKTITSDIAEIQKGLASGELLMATLYSGDALAAADLNSNIAYSIPQEGTDYWSDFLAIPRSSEQQELAHAYIDFVIEPKVHARNAMYLMYPCPNSEALKIIEKEAPKQLTNPAIYPPDSIADKLQTIDPNTPYRNYYWKKMLR